MDSHGLLWQASPSGVSVYDRKSGQMQLLDMKSGFYGSNVVAMAEDDQHSMWVVTDHGISNVTPQKDEDDGHWTFAVRSFNERDGLQSGPFNQRAICFTRTGYLLVGGQEGLNIINTPSFTLKSSENQFTIQMGSDNGGAKNNNRFVYRLKGFNDKWITTTASQPDITYMGLPAGSYTGWKYRKTLRNMFKKTKQDDLNVLIDDSETPADDEIEEAVLMDDEEK